MKNKYLFIYVCPVCRTLHKVKAEDTYRTLLQTVCHECPVCKRKTVLVYEACYWKDNKPHLNQDIDILYYDDYLKKKKEMRRTELHKGILRKVERNGLTLEELCEKICKELNIDHYEFHTWYRTLRGECNDYVAHNGELYHIEDEELEYGELNSIIKNEDGTYSYIEEFWNGGTDLIGRLEDSLENLDSNN